MPDTAAKHAVIRKASLQSWRRFDKHAEGSAAGLLPSCMPQQEKRPPRRLCPKIEPSAFNQTKGFWISMNFKDRRNKGLAFKCSLRKPQRILQPARRGMKDHVGIYAELLYSSGIGNTCFASGEAVGYPKHRPFPDVAGIQQPDKRESKAACSAGIIKGSGADLGKRIKQQAAIQCIVELRNIERQAFAVVRPTGKIFHLRCSHCRQISAFQSGNLFSQGK